MRRYNKITTFHIYKDKVSLWNWSWKPSHFNSNIVFHYKMSHFELVCIKLAQHAINFFNLWYEEWSSNLVNLCSGWIKLTSGLTLIRSSNEFSSTDVFGNSSILQSSSASLRNSGPTIQSWSLLGTLFEFLFLWHNQLH